MDDRRHKLARLSLLEKALRQGLEMFVNTGAGVNEKALPGEVDGVTECKADCRPDNRDDKDERNCSPKRVEWLRERKGHRLTGVKVVKDLPDDFRGLERNDGVRKRQHCDRNE